MITKGIVEEIVGYKARVRLPIYDGIAGNTESTKKVDLPFATICSLSNIENPVSVGDIVYVSFEDNDTNKPIIIGHLYKAQKNEFSADITTRRLITTSTTKLNKETYIGDVKPNEIQMLTGIKGNIQQQLDKLTDDLGNTQTSSEPLSPTVVAVTPNLNKITISDAAVTLAMDSHTYYILDNNKVTSIKLTLNNISSDEISEYLLEFTINSGNSRPTITLPTGVKYANNWVVSDFIAKYKYILYIVNNNCYVSFVGV